MTKNKRRNGAQSEMKSPIRGYGVLPNKRTDVPRGMPVLPFLTAKGIACSDCGVSNRIGSLIIVISCRIQSTALENLHQILSNCMELHRYL